jgi:hypothetical protein
MALEQTGQATTIRTLNHEQRERDLTIGIWAEPDGSAPELRISIANPDSEHYEEVVVPASAVGAIEQIISAAPEN